MSPSCPGVLNIAGVHYPCEQEVDWTHKHPGLAHTNKDAEAVWKGYEEVDG